MIHFVSLSGIVLAAGICGLGIPTARHWIERRRCERWLRQMRKKSGM
jgi:hypothetical protein